MKKSLFLTSERPIFTCMVQAKTPSRIKELVARAISEGAEAIGMQFCKLEPEYKTEETFRELFSLSDLPTYVTNYRGIRGNANAGKSDEELGEELVQFAEYGATLCDVMADYYDPTEGELTKNPEAIEKQKRLIDRIHTAGGEVLMSSHVLKFIPAEQVLEIARAHVARGADISKIVTGAENREQEIENLRILNLLKAELKIPFLFLSGGESRISRRLGGTLGNCMTLSVCEYDELATKAQPLLCDMVEIRRLFEV